jgi:threonine/homoserine/homoserine lactone efflux protein
LLVAFGFAAALQRWPSVWLVLRWGGVAYLSWLGIQSLRRAFRVRPAVAAAGTAPPRAWWQAFGSGFATNVLNPSLAAFYLIVLPQFVPRGAPFTSGVMTLTAIHVGMAFSWHVSWALAGATLARVLSRRRPRQVLDVVTGVALMILAIKVAV